MKKSLLLMAALLVSGFTTAQTLRVHKTDGTVTEIPTAEISFIDFAEAVNAPIYVGEWKVKSFEYTPEGIYNLWGGRDHFVCRLAHAECQRFLCHHRKLHDHLLAK